MTTLVYTVTETLRYRGKVGQWAWVFHRVAGLGTLLFLVLHVIDTSWAAFYPELYAQAIREYQSPLFTIGEFALVGCVVYHAFNGLRVALLDWKPAWWVHQGRAMLYVVIATAVVLVPVFILMLRHVVNFYQDNEDIAGLDEIASTMSQFALGFVVIIGAALVLSGLYGLVTRSKQGTRLPGRLEASLWGFMRLSGVLILPLVFGHLAIMHVIQGVFDITGGGLTVVGTDAVNASGKAVEFVGQRWDYLVAGVAVWRVYDGFLLALALIHGFNGLRYVVNDYARHPIVNRALNWATLFGMVALIVLGAAALLAGVDDTAYKIANEVTFGHE
ncbi:MAG: succinate dehydrogenase, cytochrome b556 subunit [Chloroflexota bacterium]|jgi:succinate dehydrogenase cytochrome b556 subunit|nr:succinate dehydrogenase, cytochrome b556 subunit [Anaerolineae bacterium]HMM29661.1 succinate dehydrogenase, cytochrome b556 subunit [Aggregatilineaceae bacterium]